MLSLYGYLYSGASTLVPLRRYQHVCTALVLHKLLRCYCVPTKFVLCWSDTCRNMLLDLYCTGDTCYDYAHLPGLYWHFTGSAPVVPLPLQ